MAGKVGLLDIPGKRLERVKRSRADLLVRRLLAVQITSYLYQRILERKAGEISVKPYIPGVLPSPEITNCRFEDPRLKGKSSPRVFWKWMWND